MKNVLIGKQWVLETLLQGGIKSIVNGSVYKDRRNSGSDKEDVVINDVVMDNKFFQDGIFNVNVYVPFLEVNHQGTPQYQPDHARMLELTTLIYPILHEVYTKKYNLSIVSTRTYEETALKTNYINFIINLKAYN